MDTHAARPRFVAGAGADQHEFRKMGKMEYDDDWQRNEKERTALRSFKPDLAPGGGGAEFAFRNMDKLEVDDDWQRNEKERTALRGFKPDTAPAGTDCSGTAH